MPKQALLGAKGDIVVKCTYFFYYHCPIEDSKVQENKYDSLNYRVLLADLFVLNRSDLPTQGHGFPRAEMPVQKCTYIVI